MTASFDHPNSVNLLTENTYLVAMVLLGLSHFVETVRDGHFPVRRNEGDGENWSSGGTICLDLLRVPDMTSQKWSPLSWWGFACYLDSSSPSPSKPSISKGDTTKTKRSE
ncbi:hypothetical protein MLD38_014629 [Melastoma candidum]|uniref:Uncharacterized protein n=1 Tax=Melastoma candidum TaxID=119954 RepID=A0ACB9RDZ1_9MYRT|nr:hypothetical protein MLD38_014629 [Melastoma candidum]